MKKLVCGFLIVCFLVVTAGIRPARAGDPFSIGAALLGGFLIGTIWAPRVEVRGPTVQYQYPQPQYRGGHYPAPQYYSPPAHYQAPAYSPPPPPAPIAPTTVCAQDISGKVNCRTIQY